MSYILAYPGIVLRLLLEHVTIVGSAALLATLVALPLSLLAVRHPRFGVALLGVLGALYTVPSIALIILLIPVFGLNARAVIAALVLYMQVILVRNFVAGLRGVDTAILEAARAMGMSVWQVWRRVHIPLALPVMLAGERIALVTALAIAAIGAKFGAGGLGQLLFEGISQSGRTDKIWAGALSVAALAWAANAGLRALERLVSYTTIKEGKECYGRLVDIP